MFFVIYRVYMYTFLLFYVLVRDAKRGLNSTDANMVPQNWHQKMRKLHPILICDKMWSKTKINTIKKVFVYLSQCVNTNH